MSPRIDFRLRAPWSPALGALLLALAGCTTWTEQLARAESHYQNSRYEAALANLEDMEPHVAVLSPSEHARYALVRGRAHLRLEQRMEARYWLRLAREISEQQRDALSEAARRGLDSALADLDTPPRLPAAPGPSTSTAPPPGATGPSAGSRR